MLLEALTNSCKRYGICLETGTTVNSLTTRYGRVAGIESSRGFVAAERVVVAGGAWTSMIKGLPAIPIEPVRGQMLCFRGEPKATKHVVYSRRGYIVPRQDGRLLAGSTVEHVGYDKDVSTDGLQTIRSHAFEISPSLLKLPLIDSWAGLRPRSADNLPVIGACGEIEGLVYATGHYRNGILLAPVTGRLVAAAILEKELPPLMTPFNADRFGLVPCDANC